MRKYISFIIMLIIILQNESMIVNAREIDLQKEYVFPNKPISEFSVLKDNKIIGYSNSNFYDSSIYEFDQLPNEITLKLGEKIKLNDLSTPSFGKKITSWDLQIYPPNSSERIYLFTKKDDANLEIVLDEVGTWDIYLAVKDNTRFIEGFENVSINGNHRWLGKSKELNDTYIWWYFSQLRINVIDVDKEEIPNDDTELTISENKDGKLDSNMPTTEIFLPNVFYPIEITNSKEYVNKITWDYYDADDDEVINSGYKLYKKIENDYKLIEEKEDLVKASERKLFIDGEMLDEFKLNVWVINDVDEKAYDTKEFKINKFVPKLEINTSARTYIDEEIEIKIIQDNTLFPNKYLNYDYKNWFVTDELGTIVIEGKGKIPEKLFISSDKFMERNYYYVVQNISFKDEIIHLKSKFYIVEVVPPDVNVTNMTGYYGKKYNIKTSINQKQSKEKGDLKDYIFEKEYAKFYYEIYDEKNNKVYKENSLINEIILNEKYGINKSDTNQTYKVMQYVTNSKNKTGVGIGYIEVKAVNETTINLEILERDNDVTTVPNQIYKNESLLFKAEILEGFYKIQDTYYTVRDKNENIILETNKGVLNGLKNFNYGKGNYQVTQYAIDVNGNEYKKSVDFIVKEIIKPIIFLTTFPKENYTYREQIKVDYEIYDINKSEEHPKGFNLKNYYEVDNLVKEGIFNDINANEFEKEQYKKVIQYSQNIEHNEIISSHDFLFKVVNLGPEIELKSKDIMYIDETEELSIRIKDVDGSIIDYQFDFENEFIDVIDKDIINSINEIEIKLKIKGEIEGIEKVLVRATDDSNKQVNYSKQIQILKNDIPTTIYIENEENIELKQDRYIKWHLISNKAQNVELEYTDSNIYKKINLDSRIYEDDNIKLYFDIIENNRLTFSMYFKKEGNYKFRGRGRIENKYGIYTVKEVEIAPCEIPYIEIETNSVITRNLDSKEAVIKGQIRYKNLSSDNYTKIYIFSENNSLLGEVNVINDMFEYRCSKNELGKYYLKAYTKNFITQLPEKGHILYEEILSKEKEFYSTLKEVTIINLRPTLTYNIFNKDMKITKYYEER